MKQSHRVSALVGIVLTIVGIAIFMRYGYPSSQRYSSVSLGNKITDIGFANDGMIALATEQKLILTDTTCQQQDPAIRNPAGKFISRISPNTVLLATGEDDRFSIWDIRMGKPIFQSPPDSGSSIFLMAWSADSRLLVMVKTRWNPSTDIQEIEVWDTLHHQRIHQFEGPQRGGYPVSINSIIWHPDATVLAITDLSEVWLIDSHNGAVRQHVPISSTGGKGLAWSPDGTWVVTGKTLWTYTNQQLTEVRDLDGPDDEVSVASFSGDSRFVALGTGSRREGKMEPSDTNIYVWQIDTPRRRATFSQHTAIITSIAVNQDATMIVSGDKSGRVYCWAR